VSLRFWKVLLCRSLVFNIYFFICIQTCIQKLSGQGQKTVLLSLLEYGRLLALASGGIRMYFAQYGTCILVSTPIWILRAKNCALRCPDVNLILLKKESWSASPSQIPELNVNLTERTVFTLVHAHCTVHTITSLKISNVYEKCKFNIGDLTYSGGFCNGCITKLI